MERMIIYEPDEKFGSIKKSILTKNLGLDFYYEKLECTTIDIPFLSEELSKRNIDIIIDDEGKLNNKRPCAVIYDVKNNRFIDYLAGKIMFASVNDEGKTIGLTSEQEEYISSLSYGDVWINNELCRVLVIKY